MARHCRKSLIIVVVGLSFIAEGLQAQGTRALTPEAAEAVLGDRLADYLDAGKRILSGGDARGPQAGGGAGAKDLVVIQVEYKNDSDDNGENALLWIWENTSANPDGLLLFLDTIPIHVYDNFGNDLGVLLLPGDATFVLVFLDNSEVPHPATCELHWNGGFVTDTISFVDSQPFENPKVTCSGGPVDFDTGFCSLEVSIQNDGVPLPSFYSLSGQDEMPIDEDIPGSATSHSLPGYEAGEQCVTLTGWLLKSQSHYLGDPIESCCTMECNPNACFSPTQVESCQSAFGPGETDNSVTLEWKNSTVGYEEILVTLDGEAREPVEGTVTEMLLEGLAPGEHELLLQGNCGEGKDEAEPMTVTFTLLSEMPEGDAPSDLTCKFTFSDYSVITVEWKNTGDASYHEIFVVNKDGEKRLAQTVSGRAEGANVEDTAQGETLAIRSFYSKDGACFSSDFAICEPTRPPGFRYLVSDCNGNDNLDLTDAIFALNHLFKGGEAPPCPASCDSNTDGVFDLADGIYTLNHLFLGGPEPGGNYPECDEGYPDDFLSCPETRCFR